MKDLGKLLFYNKKREVKFACAEIALVGHLNGDYSTWKSQID